MASIQTARGIIAAFFLEAAYVIYPRSIGVNTQ
jgi:hypothetical protein